MTTILLVEDVPEILKTQAILLRKAGFEVIETASATGALEILASEHIDVLFSDIRLGNESGLELAYQVHRDYPEIAVVLTTGYSGGAHEIRWPLIMKPYLSEQAVQLINKTLLQRGNI